MLRRSIQNVCIIRSYAQNLRFSADVQKSVLANTAAPKEAEGLAQTYATYLESSQKLAELHEKYKGKQKTVEQSAELVGLRVPEKRKFD